MGLIDKLVKSIKKPNKGDNRDQRMHSGEAGPQGMTADGTTDEPVDRLDHCALCGIKFGVFVGKVNVSDGTVCTDCWTKAGLGLDYRSIGNARLKTIRQLQDRIEIEAFKRKAEAYVKKHRMTDPNRLVHPKFKDEDAEPVDLGLIVGEDGKVTFICSGSPVISFDDLTNGNEMIIGDGMVQNNYDKPLPDIRIACEFYPPIVDPGLIYYKAGTFGAGDDRKLDIDDPPVNLEEYAKIKRTECGNIKFTLFLDEYEVSSVECAMKIIPAPEDAMQDLMQAVSYEEEKNASGPVNVVLHATDDGHFEIDLLRHPELLYSMYSNGREQLIGDVYVSNKTDKELKGIRFEARYTSDILSPVDVFLGDVPAGKNLCFGVDDPAIDIGKLENLSEVEDCTATYKITVDGKTVAEASGRVMICPYDQWNAALILLPAYMTPNHPKVAGLLQNASRWMLLNGMDPSLEGYQSDSKRVEEMVCAVYNAIKDAHIIYSNPPASFFGPQRIRLCDTIFEQKFATCMDMTILFASCLESFGLNTILITAPGHIFAGVWLDSRGRLKEPILSDAKLILSYIVNGSLLAIECTAMNAGQNIVYSEAKDIATKTIEAIIKNHISQHESIDVHMIREMGIKPLPMRVGEDHEYNVSTEKSRKSRGTEKEKASEETTKDSTKPEKTPPKRAEVRSEKYKLEEYRSYEGDLSFINIDNFYDKESKKVLKDAIAEIVAVEGPVSQSSLMKTLTGATSLGRVGSQIAEHLDGLVASAKVKITRQSGERYLWNYGADPNDYYIYRKKDRRDPDDICKYELKNAVCCLLQENGAMTKEEITKVLVSLFGYSRSSKKLEDGAKLAIKAARELGAAEFNAEKKLELK